MERFLSIVHSLEYSESGAIDDPHLATADKGQRFYDGLGKELAKLLEQIYTETRSR